MNVVAPTPRTDRKLLAVSAIVVSTLALSAGDAVIKLTSASFPIWQIFVLRSAFAVPVLLLLLRRRESSRPLLPNRTRWVLLRSSLLVAMWIIYYTALPRIDLSLAAAAYYTAPLLITVLSARLAGDRVGGVIKGAVVLGFAGVLVMLRPGSVPLDVYVALPFIAAILYSLAMVITRARCAGESPFVLSLALNVAFVLTGTVATAIGSLMTVPENWQQINPFLFGSWTVLGPQEWLTIGALAFAMLVGSIGAAVAYQSGPAPIVATFDYTYLVFAGLWGFLLFSEVPDTMTAVGMLMIVAGGVLAITRSVPR